VEGAGGWRQNVTCKRLTRQDDMDKALKQKFRSDFLKVRGLVNEFDPCNLIKGGAPDDEYDGLTYKVISLSYLGKTREEMKTTIIFDLEHHYGCLDTRLLEDNHQLAIQFFKDMDTFLNKVETAIH
jgi:hypothetical protein